MTVAVRILNILIIKEERKIRGHISNLQVWRCCFAEKSHAEPEEKKDLEEKKLSMALNNSTIH